jgi:hypothetical protein
VIISGLEQLQNSGKEALIDLMESRLGVAETTMKNLISEGLYSDGSLGNNIEGLQAAITPSGTDSYGTIANATWDFWINARQTYTPATDLLSSMNALWANLVRGSDRPDLIIGDTGFWTEYVGLLQAEQRFMSADTGNFGFPTVKFMDCDVCLDGGIYFPSRASGPFTAPPSAGQGGSKPVGSAYFLNCDYLHYRPHRDRNMVPLSPNKRYSVNQDAEVQIIAWAGNLTTSGRRMQGLLTSL